MDDDRFLPTVTPHIPAMLRVATALVGRAEAEDMVQEALTKAWRGWHALRDAQAIHAWLLRITINLCRNAYRSRASGAMAALQSLDADDLLVSTIQAQHPLETDPGNHASIFDLRDAVQALPEPLRLVIALRYYAGLDATEIGRLLAVPPATIRTRLRRALALLRATLSDQPVAAPEEEANA